MDWQSLSDWDRQTPGQTLLGLATALLAGKGRVIQHAAKLVCTLVVGKGGSGKTTFALRYLVSDTDLTCRFIFDPRGDISERLRIPPAELEPELELALEDRFVIFDPALMFPGNHQAGLEYFCNWVNLKCQRMPGRKVLMIDEVWKYCSPNSLCLPLGVAVLDGRKFGLETMFVAQQPNRLNESILAQVTELVAFHLQGENGLAKFKKLVAVEVPLEEIQSLPMGSYVAVSESGGVLRGRVF